MELYEAPSDNKKWKYIFNSSAFNCHDGSPNQIYVRRINCKESKIEQTHLCLEDSPVVLHRPASIYNMKIVSSSKGKIVRKHFFIS